MHAWGLTDAGTVRAQNQDAFAIVPLSGGALLAAVCDGMGGALSGDVASHMALNAFQNGVKRGWRRALSDEGVRDLLLGALHDANESVYRQSYSDQSFQGMGTTIVAVLAYKSTAMVLNVGDSRAYHIQPDDYRCVTVDHSYVQMMLDRGVITKSQAQHHPKKNLITRAVGTSPEVIGDVFQTTLKTGESMLLCSDGLSNVLSDQEILYEVLHGGSNETCCERLLEIAKKRGAPDNLPAVLVCG